MIDVIMNQSPLGLCDRFLNSVKLLGKIKTRSAIAYHLDDFPQVAIRSAKALNYLGVTGMNMCFHPRTISSPRGYKRSPCHIPTVPNGNYLIELHCIADQHF